MITTEQSLSEQTLQEEPPKESSNRDETIRSLMYLVQHVAGRLVARLPSHVSKEDLISAGLVGLIDAVDRYNPMKGCSLKTYSSLRIRGAMVDELRSQDWVPRTVHRDEKIYTAAAERISQKLGREAEPEEIRLELGVDQETFQHLSERAQNITTFSLNEVWSDEDGHVVDRGDIMPDLEAKTASEEVLREEDRQLLRGELDRLPRIQKLVLTLYYLEDLRLKEIAQILDVTESRVSQINTEALAQLKAVMRRARNR